jgi:hypothetical protein
MKRIITIVLLAVACLITASSANAQVVTKATIPFDFAVEQQVLPAGTYLITQVSPGVLDFQNRARLIHLRFGVIPSDSVSERPNRMIFHQYGDRYFLSQLRGGVGESVSKFYPSRLEKNIRLEQSAAVTQLTEEIAMK